MAFGAVNFNPEEAIAIARAEQLAQWRKTVAEAVAKASGSSAPPQRAGRAGSSGDAAAGLRNGREHADSGSEDDQDIVGTVLGASDQFALQRRPRSNSPSARPPDPEALRRAANELGLRAGRRGRRPVPRPQEALASSPAMALAVLFPKPEGACEVHYAGEDGRAPVPAEDDDDLPPEWRQGVPSTGHRLGAPPLRCHAPDPASTPIRRDEFRRHGAVRPGQGQPARQGDRRPWAHQSFKVSQDLWFGITEDSSSSMDARDSNHFGVPPVVRYRPAPRDSPEILRPPPASRPSAARKAAPATPKAQKPTSSGISVLPLAATGATGADWHRNESWDVWDDWEAEAKELTAPHAQSADAGLGWTSPAERPASAQDPGGEQLAAEESAAPPAGVEAATFDIGDRVRIVGLKSRPEMNGLLGTIIEKREDQRLQVAMDDDTGMKIFKVRNLECLHIDIDACPPTDYMDGPPEVD